MDDGDINAAGVQILGHVMAAIAGAQDQGLAPRPLMAGKIGAGMHDVAREVIQARQIRVNGNAADPGGEDHVTGMDNAVTTIRAVQRDVPPTGGLVIGAAAERGGGPYVQFHALGIGLEPVGQFILGDIERPVRWKRHVG